MCSVIAIEALSASIWRLREEEGRVLISEDFQHRRLDVCW